MEIKNIIIRIQGTKKIAIFVCFYQGNSENGGNVSRKHQNHLVRSHKCQKAIIARKYEQH